MSELEDAIGRTRRRLELYNVHVPESRKIFPARAIGDLLRIADAAGFHGPPLPRCWCGAEAKAREPIGYGLWYFGCEEHGGSIGHDEATARENWRKLRGAS